MDELGHLHDDGVFLRREALAFGYEDRDLTRAVRTRVLHRIRQGAYVAGPIWAAADHVERHRLRCTAVLLTHGHRVALSHGSAAVHHDMRLWDVPLERVHVLRLDGGPGRVCGDVVYHSGSWRPDDVWQLGDRLLTSPARAAIETASLVGVERALVVFDGAIDLGLATPEELAAMYLRMDAWPRTQHLQVPIRLMRRGAQSVGETRSRYLCWAQGLPEPELQFEVRNEMGVLVGVADMAWPEYGVLGEFDGKVKYQRLLLPGETPGDAVFREKQREDAMRRITGWVYVRLIWWDLGRPRATAMLIRQQLGLRAA
jgi:hypothetical protein